MKVVSLSSSIDLNCQRCGEPFSVFPSRKGTAKYCSTGCRDKESVKRYDSKRITLLCKQCGGSYKTPPCNAERRVYCSYECHAEAERGAIHQPRAEGNVSKHSQGWILERSKLHPYNVSGYVLQHRLVVERWMRKFSPQHSFLIEIGAERYLGREISVHHLNEIKDDNRIENLLPCTRSMHSSIHAAMKIVPEHLWAEVIRKIEADLGLPSRKNVF